MFFGRVTKAKGSEGDMDEHMRRRGRFTIPRKLLVEDFEAAKGIFQLCFPIRAEMMLDQDAIEYTAIGYVFGEVPEGEITPWYSVVVDRSGLTVGIEFQRQENN